MNHAPLDDETLRRLYAWIDEIPLSRPKKSIARDFSDGILTAEVVAFYFPKLVQMHNYSAANSVKQKLYNWNALNRKVLRKLQICLSKDDMDDLVQCRPGAVESLLVKLQLKIANYQEKRPPSAHYRRPHSDEDASPVSSPAVSSPGSTFSTARNQPLSPAYEKVAEVREPLVHHMKELSMREPVDMYPESAASPHAVPHQSEGFSSPKAELTGQDHQEELVEKDNTILELRETIQILEMKVQKLEQLVRLKDGKIQTLVAKLRSQKPPA